jgi:uncharacterized protein YjiS (DUF1127 family)
MDRAADGRTQVEEPMSHIASNALHAGRPERAGQSFIAGLAAAIGSLAAASARLWIIRRDERLLMAAPDEQLKDIGIARADIRGAVRTGRIGAHARSR